ncbi:crotonase/enoyl-CoA hydratase family protein [Marinicella litoralis]|uniref:Enoyl-CoA hydratase/carnithine racemase n=1 Tax=Marinicella litoralis TaxID=644220 RepID=A0A4V3DIL3_9GAMM|nr:crotonase/enoyl-CoA hydratase family protein [Marinicella litoralis]TDR22561.1 enoyl-CoA hydratase/carnithine racemase [Marinicella litoralis]
MSNENRVEVKIKHSIAYVSLARPEKMNALDMAMFQSIVSTIKALRKNRGIRAVIVSGQGDNFCSGLDVKSMMISPTGPLKLLKKINPWSANMAQRVSADWQKVSAPVIMAIHGRCWGGGLHIALGGDIRIATPDASLSIMEGRWGMIPDMGGLLALRTHCRIDVAKELTMTAKIITGEEAQKAGLVTHVTENPMKMAQALAEEICQQSPDSVAAVKKLYNKSWIGGRGTALMRETLYQLRVILGKNSKIKIHNQTHDEDKQRHFLPRKKW